MGPPKWLIEGILPRWSYGMLYGPSGSGKSFLALEMAICVATGANFHRRATRATGGAFYVAAEDPRDFPIRELALAEVPRRPGQAGRALPAGLADAQPARQSGEARGLHPQDRPRTGDHRHRHPERDLSGQRDRDKEHLGSQHLLNDGDFVLRMDGEPTKPGVN